MAAGWYSNRLRADGTENGGAGGGMDWGLMLWVWVKEQKDNDLCPGINGGAGSVAGDPMHSDGGAVSSWSLGGAVGIVTTSVHVVVVAVPPRIILSQSVQPCRAASALCMLTPSSADGKVDRLTCNVNRP